MIVARRFVVRICQLLRELSDEAAYERHLRTVGRAHSAEEWKQFADERYRRKYEHAKCC